ncbi:MAG: hypothetical protein CMQ41_12640 [Gammaproteobacteria bacterium]|nr:hypothetical protein [Gammaproteobacteria bacterium]|tara:strand:- start:550 stop:1575 length:1026 start_codon:yes stop_codon:yes gene_type:complete
MQTRFLEYIFGLLLTLKYVLFSVFIYAQEPEQERQPNKETDARALEISREIFSRQTAIRNIQNDIGIFDQSLIEAYRDMARFYTELEDYENATQFYIEALQIARINTGLYSYEQISILDSLIASNISADKWQEADNFHELSYLINSRLYADANLKYLQAAETYGAWKLRLVRENLLEQSGFSLLNTAEELSQFYERAIERLEFSSEVKAEHLLKIIYGKSQVDLTLARSVAATPYTAFEGTERPYINQTRCQNVRNSQGQVVRQCYSVQVENPRYRISQRDAKQFALQRHTRDISSSIAKLEEIKNTSSELSNAEKQQIELQISELVTESEQLVRSTRRLL